MDEIMLLKFPALKMETIWGDGTLARRYKLELSPDTDINKCPFGGGFLDLNIITNGEFEGKTIKWLYDNHKEYFGDKNELRWDDILPVSMAACWASEDLSIQVHPREDWSLKNLGIHGKSECWYFPEVDSDYKTVVSGCRAKTMDELNDYIKREAWEELIIRKPVKAGSFYAIKAGTLHAIQKGCYFIEICNPSPVTYRFYDYGRLDSNGLPRKLDLEKAKENILVPDQPIQYQEIEMDYGDVHERFMADNEDYSAWLYQVNGKGSVPKKKPYAGCFVINGEGTVNGLAVKAGQTFFASKACKSLIFEGKMDIICCHS